MKYTGYVINRDFFKQRKHIYYLEALVEDKNVGYIIASYSLKTKQLLIKGANSHIPQSEVLNEFVKICEKYGEWE